MPMQQSEVGHDPTRTVLLRAAKWWWLGAAITVVVAALYFAAAGSASSTVSVERAVWFDQPPGIVTGAATVVAETVDQSTHDDALPSTVSMRLLDVHAVVTVSGSTSRVASDFDKALEILAGHYQKVITAKLQPLKDAAQREVDTATKRSEAVGATVAAAPQGSTTAIVGLTRILALEDDAAKARTKVSDIDAQLAKTDYVRAQALSEQSTRPAGRGVFDLAVGLVFGAVLGGIAMLVAGTALRRVGRTADIAQGKVLGVPLVNATSATLATDALVVAGAVPPAPQGCVVVSSSGQVPPPILAAVRQRNAGAEEVDGSPSKVESEALDFASKIDGNTVVLVVTRGTATTHAERLVDIVTARADHVAAVVVVPR